MYGVSIDIFIVIVIVVLAILFKMIKGFAGLLVRLALFGTVFYLLLNFLEIV